GEEIPFDEENWEEAEKFIQDSRKKEKRRRWAFIYLIGLGSGVLLMLPFIIKTSHNNVTTIDKANTQQTKGNKDLTIAENTNKTEPTKNTPTTTVQETDTTQHISSTPSVVTNKADVKSTQPVAVMNETKKPKSVVYNSSSMVISKKENPKSTVSVTSKEM